MRVVLPKLEKMPAAKIAEALRTNIAELGLSEQEEQGRLFATLRFVEQGLAEELRPLLGLIGLHEGYVQVHLLEAMAKKVDGDWTRERIDRFMVALGVAGLARDVGNSAYEMHPLLTSYLRSRGDAPERCQRVFAKTMGSLADYLAGRQYHEQRIPFILHAANFHFALDLAERLSIGWAFAALIQSLALYTQGSRNFGEASRLFERLAGHEAARGESEGEAAAYHQLGMIAAEQRDFETAREWYLKSLTISEKQGNLQGAAGTYHQLGRIAEEVRDFGTAREWYLKSLAITEKQGNLQGAARTYHQLGRIAEEERDFGTAREWYLKSLAIHAKQGNLHGAAITSHQLGKIAEKGRDFETAREWYLKSLSISEKQGNLLLAASTYGQMGRIAAEQRDFETAREWCLKSLVIKEKQDDLHGAGITSGQLGIIAGLQGSFEEGGRWLSRCIATLIQTHDQYEAERNIGNFLLLHRRASPEDKQKLQAIWRDANLGPFPTET
jgi:tetratricopeptide (TPR) repeat protein